MGDIFQFLGTANNPRSDLSEHGDVKYVHYGDIHTRFRSFLDCENDSLPLIDGNKVKNIPFLEDGDLVMVDASEDYEGIGKSVEVRNATGRGAVAGLHTFLLRGDKDSLAEGFKGYLQFISSMKNALIKIATGISVYGITKNNVRNIEVALPGFQEQRAIAAVLSDVDSLIASLDKLISKKRDIKQAAMQQLLTAKTRLPGFSGEWETKRLGEIAAIQRGASPRPIDSPIWFDDNSEVGWVRISDVTQSGMFLRETTQRLSALGVRRSRPVSRGSLIMSICATVGRPVITEIATCIHDGFVVFDNLGANKRYLYYVLKSIESDWGKHGQTGSQMNLNTGLINRTEVAVPRTEDEQRSIVAVLSDMDAEIAALEVRRDKTRALKGGMMQELLTGRIRLV